jgi:hypothetical protein
MLSIIIVNYHSVQLIGDCISSIKQFSGNLSHEIIIVDNGSSEKDKENIQLSFSDIRWISMGYNSGFARANNEGIRQARGETVLLLNPDTLMEDNAIEICYNRFKDSDYTGGGVQLLNPDRSPQISGNYFIKGGVNNLLPLPFLGKVVKWLGSSLNVKKTNVPEAKERVEVDWINGAFLMVKKKDIEKAGLLDEDFFLYAEEIEWCSRLRKYGALCVYGDLHVLHLEGGAANKAFDSSGKGYYNLYDRKGRQILLSNFVRIRKQFGVAWFVLHLCFYLAEIPFFLVTVIFQKLFQKQSYPGFIQFWGYLSNLGFLLGKAFIIIRNKPYFYKAL